MDRPATNFGWQSADAHAHQSMVLPAVLRLLPPPPARLLDLGCGNGWLSERYRQAGYTVTACDRSTDGLALGRQAYPLVEFLERDVYEDLGGPYDAVTSSEVIEHLFAPARMLARVHAALKPGGTLVLTTPYHGWLKNLAIAATGKFDSHVDVAFEGGHIKFFSRASLAKMLRQAGFDDIRFAGTGRVPGLWKSMVMAARR